MKGKDVNRSRTGSTWDNEDAWWGQNFKDRPYVQSGLGYDYYRPAYQYGFESAQHHSGRSFDEAENDLKSGWAKMSTGGAASGARGAWEDVKDAVRDAWHRVTGQGDLDTDRMGSGSTIGGRATNDRTL